MEAHIQRASLLRRAIDAVLVKALGCQCFIESTYNVSYGISDKNGNVLRPYIRSCM